MIAEDRLGEDVVDPILGLVLVHRDLLEDHLALGVDLARRQRRVGEHLGEEVERRLRVRVQEPRVEVRRLLAGRGVGLRAHPVEELGDLDRGAARRSLEQQVLEEVREPRLRGCLIA